MHQAIKAHLSAVIGSSTAEMDLIDVYFREVLLKKKEFLPEGGQVLSNCSKLPWNYTVTSPISRNSCAGASPRIHLRSFRRKKKFAAKDFSSVVRKYEDDHGYASAKIMSLTYWAWAKGHSGKRFRQQALSYLTKAVARWIPKVWAEG